MEIGHTIVDDLRSLDMYNKWTIGEFQNEYLNDNQRREKSEEDREQAGEKE